jgi:hypothetical protein
MSWAVSSVTSLGPITKTRSGPAVTPTHSGFGATRNSNCQPMLRPMGGYLHLSLGYGDLFVLAWFVASAATVGGGLGTGLESDEAIRAAAYSKREEDRRDRLARDRNPKRSAR